MPFLTEPSRATMQKAPGTKSSHVAQAPLKMRRFTPPVIKRPSLFKVNGVRLLGIAADRFRTGWAAAGRLAAAAGRFRTNAETAAFVGRPSGSTDSVCVYA